MSLKVGIIGAGLGGISAALYLSQNPNFEISIFEKNDYAGGKLGQMLLDGFRFDTGPSVLTLIDVIKDVFIFCGENPDRYLEFDCLETINRNFFDDGYFIDTISNVQKFQNELEKIDKNSAKNLSNYLRRTQSIFDRTADIFLFSQLHEIKFLIKTGKIPKFSDFFKIDAFKSMHEVNSNYFKNKQIQQIFDRYATYNGSSPYLAPGTLNLISYVEIILGAYYIKGGIYKLADEMKKLAEKFGIKFHFNKLVNEIQIENNIARKLVVDGKNYDFDIIISNSDIVHTNTNLIKRFERDREKALKIEPSISGMVFLWGIKGIHKDLIHHNLFYSNDYELEFKEIFEENKAPESPSIYIAITSKSDKNHAPDGCENWFVLLNMPYNNNQDWNYEAKRLKQYIINKLKIHGIDISSKIMTEKIITPQDLESRFLSNRGSIYGISSNGMFAAFKRQSNKSKKIKNLFYAGGSVHPGGGIPLVILSGKHCAEIIQREY